MDKHVKWLFRIMHVKAVQVESGHFGGKTKAILNILDLIWKVLFPIVAVHRG